MTINTNAFQSSWGVPRTASVVIDNYNYGRFLRTAIDSVLAQTLQPIEIIVVDDGSTDDSPSIIRSYGDSIIPVLKANGGMGSALNAGYARAHGDVVFFLDADDAMHANAVETVLKSWKPDVVLMHYLMDVVDANGQWLGIHPPPPHLLADGDVRKELLATGGFATTLTSGIAFLRAALMEVMPLDEKKFTQAADGYLVRAIAMLGLVQSVPERLARQCRHGQNDSEFGKDIHNLVTSFRKKIKYTSNEVETVQMMANRLGLEVNERLADSDATYLAYRIYSLALEPSTHPLVDDRMMKLLSCYFPARFANHDTMSRRIADICLATAAAALPRHLLFPLLRLRYVPHSRPRWFRLPRALRQT